MWLIRVSIVDGQKPHWSWFSIVSIKKISDFRLDTSDLKCQNGEEIILLYIKERKKKQSDEPQVGSSLGTDRAQETLPTFSETLCIYTIYTCTYKYTCNIQEIVLTCICFMSI